MILHKTFTVFSIAGNTRYFALLNYHNYFQTTVSGPEKFVLPLTHSFHCTYYSVIRLYAPILPAFV